MISEVLIEPTCKRFGFSMSEAINFLKSLRPQNNRWKPSEEQMSQLWWAAYKNKDNPHGNMLAQLYEQLKALHL